MNFHQWMSVLSYVKDHDHSFRRLGADEAYARIRARFLSMHHRAGYSKRDTIASLMGIAAEECWHRHNRPYYKVWPGMCRQLASVRMDIPGEHLHLPYPAYEIRLPVQDNPFQEGDGPALQSIIIHRYDNDPTLTMTSVDDNATVANDSRLFTALVFYQFDTDAQSDHFGWFFGLPVRRGEGLEDRVLKVWDASTRPLAPASYTPSKEFAQALLRLAVSVAFFGTDRHELICPDLPRKLVEAHAAARRNKDEAEEERLLAVARTYGLGGYHVGRELDLPRPQVVAAEDGAAAGAGAGRALEHGYMRRAHLRMQQVGPRAEGRHELRFVRSHQVRPDLPFAPARGYQIGRPQRGTTPCS